MRKFIFLIYVCLFVFNWGKAWSLIEVDITRGNLNPLPLAVSPLSVDQNSKEKFKDLTKTDLFFKKCLMLPMNMSLKNDDIDYIIDNIINFYSSFKK